MAKIAHELATPKKENPPGERRILFYTGQQKMVQCRICKKDHWTTMCPYKDTLGTLQESLNTTPGTSTPPTDADGAKGAGSTGRYVPPSQRGGVRREGESMQMRSRGENTGYFVLAGFGWRR